MKRIVFFIALTFSSLILSYLPGDVDGKNGVDVMDYVLVRNYILKKINLTEEEKTRADVDSKNGIDVMDYVLIRNIILKGGNVVSPTTLPTAVPTTKPTVQPTVEPTVKPTAVPTTKPTATPKPTAKPTAAPTPKSTIKSALYTLTFNANGGKVNPASKILNKGSKYDTLPVPTRDNYKFDGWYTKKDGGTKVTASTIINADVTIYAHWLTIEVESVSLNKTTISLEVGKTNTLSATIKPSNATDKTITWSSDNEAVATVSNSGKVKAVKSGTAKITAKVGSKSAKCTVNVTAASKPVKEIPTKIKNDFSIYTNGGVKADYSSETLKYKIYKPIDSKKDSYKYYNYALIWVKDANKQINNGSNDFQSTTRLQHFNNEVKKQSYQKKGMVGTNGGLYINGIDNIPVLATNGVIEKNQKYKTWINIGDSVKYSTTTISKDNLLIKKDVSSSDLENAGKYSGSQTERLSSEGYESFKKWLKNNGARNAWGTTHFRTSGWKEGGTIDHKTTLCQIDENNFILAVGYNAMDSGQKELHDLFGCVTIVNMDGGGSSGMFYKTNGSDVKEAHVYYKPGEEKGTSKERKIADILYFVE